MPIGHFNQQHLKKTKHMTHHMVEGFGRDWIDRFANAFLIRAPEAVIASYARAESATIVRATTSARPACSPST